MVRPHTHRGVSGATWQARTAVAVVIGAAGEGGCVLLLALGRRVRAADDRRRDRARLGLRPVVGGAGAGVPPVGLVFVSSGDDYVGQRISAALAVVLLLGGSAWVVGRVRERYGHPPWAQSRGSAR